MAETDIFSTEKRSEIMSLVRAKDTKPEKAVRSLLHRMGYRFRLHDAKLPGKPDIVLRKYRTVIFVHGCFWHQHPGCRKATIPKQNHDIWEQKLQRNKNRDKANIEALQSEGWNVLVIWECDLKNMNDLSDKLQLYLEKNESCR